MHGTNLDTDVEGYTSNGESLKDRSFDYEGTQTPEQHEDRVNNINDRNYTSMWFYSNPIFVDVVEKKKKESSLSLLRFRYFLL